MNGRTTAARRRPVAATAVAAFLFGATAIAIVVGFALLFPGALLDWLAQFNRPGMSAFERFGRAPGVFLLALSVVTAVSGIGLLRGSRRAWRLAVAIFAVDAAGDIAGYTITGDLWRSVAGLAVTSVFLWVLARPAVRTYCRR